jgi:cyclophilin family peptidyl-prolyl cis-trans isomerase
MSLALPLRDDSHPRCFFDVNCGSEPLGRIVIELFTTIAPKTCENFRQITTGQARSKTTQKQLIYTNCKFHRVIKDFAIQTGDVTHQSAAAALNSQSIAGESIYGPTFDNENFTFQVDIKLLHNEADAQAHSCTIIHID